MKRWKWTQLELDLVPKADVSSAPPGPEDIEVHRRRIEGYLSIRMPEPVDVVFTDNRSTMISFRRRGGRYRIRLHRLFRHADRPLLDLLVQYMVSRSGSASAALDRFIAAHQEEIRSPVGRSARPLRAKGCHHDLDAVLERIGQTYFGGKPDVRIGWGRRPGRRTRRRRSSISRALATYCYDDRAIRVSPVLDAGDIPDYIIEWIVYHELLHHVLPVEESGGRKRYHTSRFKALERAFVHYEEAKAWEKKNLERLLFGPAPNR